MLTEADRPVEAELELKAALELFPTYSDVDGPYLYLARIHRERGELGKAAAALTRLGNLNERAYQVHTAEAELREQIGDSAGAAQALERALLINPFEIEVHQQLAELATVLGRHTQAVQERRAVVALNPADRAEAHYRLARALFGADQREEARREVIQALEVAPNYEDALELLLELRASDGDR
jgi:tetratricopeptide (TPR) repeat protein